MMNAFFKLDALNGFVTGFIILFFALTAAYSFKFMQGRKRLVQYYIYLFLTALSSACVVLANNLVLLLVFWGFLGLLLYLLVNMGDDNTGLVAKKTLVIVGGSDALMLLGIAIVYYLSGTMRMDNIKLEFSNWLAVAAYVCIAIGCFAKSGAMPFHTWIPGCAEKAPASVVAFLPASLDKLLGIYLLARLSMDLFVMNLGLNMFLMLIGILTIIGGVMMALVQHNMKKLLGYHAISQVGYMVLGIGTGNPMGIAGGLFHMLNHAIYKSCLFLTSGNVEKSAGTVELDKLGGLSRLMPLTYISCLIASLSISGVPPFNGFVSKWMIYQGLISKWQAADSRWETMIYVFCLVAAMFGSGLTLASFMKLIHAAYLGQQPNRQAKKISEAHWTMWLPCLVLAFLCVIFGVFAVQIPLRFFILPSVGPVGFIGTWYAGLSTSLIVIGLVLGLLIFKMENLKSTLRQDAPFTGCEPMDLEENRVTGTEFYNTVKDFKLLKSIYQKAEAGLFDIYDQGKVLLFNAGGCFKRLHNGVLPTYLVWMLLGMVVLFWALLK